MPSFLHSIWSSLNSTVKSSGIDGFYLSEWAALGLLNAESSDGRGNAAAFRGSGDYKTSFFPSF